MYNFDMSQDGGEESGAGHELHMLGLSPDVPYCGLNLAGFDGIPGPTEIAHSPQDNMLREPTFTRPDMSEATLRSGNMAASPIDLMPGWQSDPLLSDATNFQTPYAMQVNRDQAMPAESNVSNDLIDNMEATLGLYPGLGFSGLNVHSNPSSPDPTLPAPQYQLTPDVVMAPQDRPGEMASDALETLHADADHSYIEEKPYRTSFMDQRGMASHRSRHLGLLMHGIDGDDRDLKDG